jgi:hypothetical protein
VCPVNPSRYGGEEETRRNVLRMSTVDQHTLVSWVAELAETAMHRGASVLQVRSGLADSDAFGHPKMAAPSPNSEELG